MPSVESINAFHKEEESSLEKTQFRELHLSTSRPIFQSLSHSDSPKPSELPPLDVPSHNVCSIIGRSLELTHLRKDPKPQSCHLWT